MIKPSKQPLRRLDIGMAMLVAGELCCTTVWTRSPATKGSPASNYSRNSASPPHSPRRLGGRSRKFFHHGITTTNSAHREIGIMISLDRPSAGAGDETPVVVIIREESPVTGAVEESWRDESTGQSPPNRFQATAPCARCTDGETSGACSRCSEPTRTSSAPSPLQPD